jgi:Transposase DDE domain group 1
MTQSTTQSVLFTEEFHKPVTVAFDQPDSSSDGGTVLLKAVDRRLSLTERLGACVLDTRQSGKVLHTSLDLLRQRIYGIAAGYPDCNDADALANDPIQKLLLDRDPIDGQSLGSQPTLSRFENAVTSKELFGMAETLADIVIEHHAERLQGKARRITIDMDPTDDPTHGAQQLSFFNGHYGTFCYLTMIGTVQFNEEKEKYLFTAVLRPGNAHCSRGAIGILSRVIGRLREAFPKAQIRVRLDGGFSTPAILDYLDSARVEYLVGFAGNSALDSQVEPLMRAVRVLSSISGKTETLFTDLVYKTKTWKHPRRLIVKAEVVRFPDRDPRDNDRYVVTNLTLKPERIYAIYRERGDMENRIKELHHGLEIDRTSCTDFKANQFRVLLTAAAYVLMQEIRREAAGTDLQSAQVSTLRERLFELAACVERSVRRIVIHLPLSCPWTPAWRTIAAAVGAQL